MAGGRAAEQCNPSAQPCSQHWAGRQPTGDEAHTKPPDHDSLPLPLAHPRPMLHHHLLLGAELARVALRALNRLRARLLPRLGVHKGVPRPRQLHWDGPPRCSLQSRAGGQASTGGCAAAAAARAANTAAVAPRSPAHAYSLHPHLTREQRKEDLDQEEEYAVERLCSWLARVQGADPVIDAALDDAQREFLLSYRLPEGGGDAVPGAPDAAPQRQFILPQRTPRGGAAADGGGGGGTNGNGCGAGAAALAGEVSRASSEEAEALGNDPELQEVLRAVSAKPFVGWLACGAGGAGLGWRRAGGWRTLLLLPSGACRPGPPARAC